MTDGKPGGQGRFDDIFSTNLIQQYQKDLKDSWRCDTIFLKIYKV